MHIINSVYTNLKKIHLNIYLFVWFLELWRKIIVSLTYSGIVERYLISRTPPSIQSYITIS